LQDLEDQVLLAHPGRVLDLQVLRDLQELRNLDLVEGANVESVSVLDGSLLARRVGKPLGRRLERLDVRLVGALSSGHLSVSLSGDTWADNAVIVCFGNSAAWG